MAPLGRQLGFACSIGVHYKNVPRAPDGVKGDTVIGTPGGVRVIETVIGQTDFIGSVWIHDVDVLVAVSIGAEYDLATGFEPIRTAVGEPIVR
jgi:hypothetical protein